MHNVNLNLLSSQETLVVQRRITKETRVVEQSTCALFVTVTLQTESFEWCGGKWYTFYVKFKEKVTV